MKKNKASYFVGIAFICVIAVFFTSVCYRVYRAQRYGDYGEVSTAETGNYFLSSESYTYDWPDTYPFSDEYKFEFDQAENQTESRTQTEQDETENSAYVTAVNTVKESVDYYTTKLLPGRMKYVEANAMFNKAVGMKIVTGTDSVLVMKNGYLTLEAYEKETDSPAASLKWFSDIMEEKGIDFAYIQYPSKENKYDNQLPSGVKDYNNINADSLLEKLDSENVKYIDMRDQLNQESSNWYTNFFVTDHHWKPETGVWAAGKIAEMLNSDFGYSLDTGIGDLNNYNIDVYEDYCFGSLGRIATLTYADPEDISLIYPKNDTDFTVTYNEKDPNTGKFEDVMFNREYLNKTDYYSYSAYSAYLNGNKAVSSIKNNNCNNGTRILIIGGSYNKSVVPYLAQTVENIDLIDRRYFNGSIIDYIEKTEPDVVLVAYTPTLIYGTGTHGSTYNFE